MERHRFATSATTLAITWLGLSLGSGMTLAWEHPAWFFGRKPSSIRDLAAPGYEVGAVAFNPDGSRLIVSYGDGTVRRFDAATGGADGTFQVSEFTEECHALAYAPDGLRFATEAPYRDQDKTDPVADQFVPFDHAVTVWDESGRVIRKFPAMSGRILGVAFSSDGECVGAIDHTYVAKAWRVRDGSMVYSTLKHGPKDQLANWPLVRVAFSADLRRLVVKDDTPETGYGSRAVRVVEADAEGPRFIPSGGSPIYCATISPDGSRVTTAHTGHHYAVMNFLTGRKLEHRWLQVPHLVPGIMRPDFVAISLDGQIILTGTAYGQVYLHYADPKVHADIKAAKLPEIDGPKGYIRAVAFLKDRIRFASGGWEGLGDERIEGTNHLKHEPVKLWEVSLK